jgi:UDP-N-acetylglucosamine--N-acetylmuramyl-(pentapeptide) pyrophosphoryl-undecaprenol N-acetylglucosamine transferase
MERNKPYRVLIGGGGTGGHVFPAIAIADAFREMEPGTGFLFVGALGRLEMEKVPEAGYRIIGLPVTGFQRRITLRNVSFFYYLLVSMIRSRMIIRQFNPDVAIGVGGYASGPILKAASRRGIPILIQEQNSYAGVTNRLLAKSAASICVAYEGMDRYFPAEKIVITGNPVRKELLESDPGKSERKVESGKNTPDLELFGLEPGLKVCLVLGGSLGARTINMSMMENLDRLGKEEVQVIWQCGKNFIDRAEKAVAESGVKNVRVYPFISGMAGAYRVADVIVSRSGAITISELCIVGKPVILVPSPNVAEDHQTSNARALVTRNAAWMVTDREAPRELVPRMLELVKDTGMQNTLSAEIRKLGIPDASVRIAGEIKKILNNQ